MRDAAARAVAALRAHPRHVLLACLVAGLLAGPIVPAAAIVTALGVMILVGRRPLVLAAAAGVLAGAFAANARIGALDHTRLGPLLGGELSTRATLLEQPRRSPSGASSALVRLLASPGRGERVLMRAGRRVHLPQASTGTLLALRGRLVALGDRDSFQRRRGAHAILVVAAVRATRDRRGGAGGALDGVRARAERALAAGLSPRQAALLRGMVLGQDEQFSEADRQDFRRSGLAHLVAASGQNVMLLAAFALALLTLGGVGLRARRWSVVAVIAAYVPLAGAGPSIQRAGVMGAAGIVAALAGRPASRWYALLLAAAATLLVNPRAASDVGWQLSFAAVIAILAFAPRVRSTLVERRVPAGLAEAVSVTVAATLATAPLIAFHFGRLSLVSLPANVLAAPAVAPIMWLGMLSAAIGQAAPPLALIVNALNAFPLAYVGWLAHASATLPASSVALRLGLTVLAGAYCVLVAGVLAPRLRLWAALATLALGAIALHARRPPSPPDPRVLRVSFLDVGQGDATLVQHDGATVLVDCGPPGGPILVRLREAGVRRVDLLAVTHAQADHEGGAAAVLARYPVGLLLDGANGAPTAEHRELVDVARRHDVRMLTPDAGQRVAAGPISLRVLWPRREPRSWHADADPNQRAIVAQVRDGDFDLLLPADAESDVTAPLALAPVDALKVAHHGSEDAGLPDLLARLRPQVAVIEVGARNPYGHPRPEALRALRVVPHVYRTDRDGTVRLDVRAGRVTVTRARHG